jgi:thymidylate synthase
LPTLLPSDTDATVVWQNNLRYVLNGGTEVSPRGFLTHELEAYKSMIDIKRPVIRSPARNLGYRFMAAEAAWILSGDNRVSSIKPWSVEISRFSDDGFTFFGAYGPKVVDQLHYVAKTLAKDPDSRQAVLEIWRPSPPETKDVPCTCLVQWLIRGGKLTCIDYMRSSDLWLGWPYDVFNFSMISLALAIRLREAYHVEVELGSLHLVAGSQHLYQKNFQGAQDVIAEFNYSEDKTKFEPLFDVSPDNFTSEGELVLRLWDMAHSQEGVMDPIAWEAQG